jgi:hypothetical protein
MVKILNELWNEQYIAAEKIRKIILNNCTLNEVIENKYLAAAAFE